MEVGVLSPCVSPAVLGADPGPEPPWAFRRGAREGLAEIPSGLRIWGGPGGKASPEMGLGGLGEEEG